MSRRHLFFGPSTVFFRCDKWMRSEKESCRYRYLGSLFFRRSTLSDRTNIDDWAEMVVRYSARQLTYATDKFPAISALAQLVNEAVKDEYIVGIWRSKLHRLLLWKSQPKRAWDSFHTSLSSPDPYVAPSWSWASRTEPVGFGLHDEFRFPRMEEAMLLGCDVLEVATNVPVRNPFGEISSAALSISGRLVPLPAMLDKWKGLQAQ